jgi:hypothetical protein
VVPTNADIRDVHNTAQTAESDKQWAWHLRVPQIAELWHPVRKALHPKCHPCAARFLGPHQGEDNPSSIHQAGRFLWSFSVCDALFGYAGWGMFFLIIENATSELRIISPMLPMTSHQCDMVGALLQ